MLAIRLLVFILGSMLQRSMTDDPRFPVITNPMEFTMTFLTPDQFAAANKANLETLFGLTNKAFEGVEKLVELNLQVAKATLSVKDAQELLALQASLLQPSAEKAAAYSRHLYDIAQSTTSEFTKTAEAQMAEMQKSFANVVDGALKNAPAGSENAVTLVKSAISAANNAYESVQKAAKQATDMAEANFTAVTSTAMKAGQAAVKSAKRAA